MGAIGGAFLGQDNARGLAKAVFLEGKAVGIEAAMRAIVISARRQFPQKRESSLLLNPAVSLADKIEGQGWCASVSAFTWLSAKIRSARLCPAREDYLTGGMLRLTNSCFARSHRFWRGSG